MRTRFASNTWDFGSVLVGARGTFNMPIQNDGNVATTLAFSGVTTPVFRIKWTTVDASSLPASAQAFQADRAINRSREDNQLLKMLVGRIVVRTQEAPMKIGRLSFNTLEDLERASVRTLQRATGGKISLSEAQRLLNMMEQHRRVTMTRNLERRTRALETDGPEKGQRKFQGTFEELLALYRDLVLSGPADAGQDAERT